MTGANITPPDHTDPIEDQSHDRLSPHAKVSCLLTSRIRLTNSLLISAQLLQKINGKSCRVSAIRLLMVQPLMNRSPPSLKRHRHWNVCHRRYERHPRLGNINAPIRTNNKHHRRRCFVRQHRIWFVRGLTLINPANRLAIGRLHRRVVSAWLSTMIAMPCRKLFLRIPTIELHRCFLVRWLDQIRWIQRTKITRNHRAENDPTSHQLPNLDVCPSVWTDRLCELKNWNDCWRRSFSRRCFVSLCELLLFSSSWIPSSDTRRHSRLSMKKWKRWKISDEHRWKVELRWERSTCLSSKRRSTNWTIWSNKLASLCPVRPPRTRKENLSSHWIIAQVTAFVQDIERLCAWMNRAFQVWSSRILHCLRWTAVALVNPFVRRKIEPVNIVSCFDGVDL